MKRYFYNENISGTLEFELTSRRPSFILKTKNGKNKASIEIRKRIYTQLKPLCFAIERIFFYEFFMKAIFFITRIFVKSTYIGTYLHFTHTTTDDTSSRW